MLNHNKGDYRHVNLYGDLTKAIGGESSPLIELTEIQPEGRMVEEEDSASTVYINWATCFMEQCCLYMLWPTEFKMK